MLTLTGTITRTIIMKSLLVLAAFSIIACNTNTPKTTPAPEPPKVPVNNNGVEIAYNKKGTGDTAIVFIHGACINKEYWKSQVDYFSKRYTTVALDLGGHGHSGHNRDSWTIEDYANDVMATIRDLNLNKVILVGHSMGGEIILQVANTIPDKIIGLVGIDNIKDVITSYNPKQKKEIAHFIQELKIHYDSIVPVFIKQSLFPPNYNDTASMNRVINDVQLMDSYIAIQTFTSLTNFSLKDAGLLSNLKVPLHLIVSDYSPMNEANVKKYCKAGLFVKTIHGTGHYPMIEKPKEFNEALDQTLQEISSGK
ncbi:MAG: hypothetical protein C5B52_10515 [Bacteroidetes bacterium]|nr:MAG: hypothetical protein C5B52_10515 [Bacteroidota bacterium]